jgi:acyl-CoA reductase-like NAD-dependent aldehyde dehydrogenase
VKTYLQYIDGKDVEGKGWTYVVRASAMMRDIDAAFNLKRALELGRPAELTEDVVARCAVGTPEDNERALAAARRASAVFRLFPQAIRSQIVIEFNQVLAARADEMVENLIVEGHPRRLAQWEVSGMLCASDAASVEWYERQLNQSYQLQDRRIELVRKPDGVVCVNPPQNAAGSNSTMAVFALLVGNAIVLKAPRSSPLAVMFLFRDLLAPILEKHGAPPGTMNLVCGNANSLLRSWASSPLVDDLLYFGGSATGLKLGEECLKNGKKAILELAGNDGFVVWHDADLEAAARALEECFYGSSQICMVPKYAIVHPRVADSFIKLFTDRVARIRPGYPEDPDSLLSPVLKVDAYFDYIAEAREAGAEVLCGARRVDVDGEESTRGMFCEPTVLRIDGLERAGGLSCVREETFFPLMPVIVPGPSPDDRLFENVVEFLNGNKYGLRNSIWTGDEQVARRFADSITNSGQLRINDSHIGFSPVLATHGGTGQTGGPYGELNYLGLRTSHLQGISWGNGDPRPLDPRVLAAPGTARG